MVNPFLPHLKTYLIVHKNGVQYFVALIFAIDIINNKNVEREGPT